MFIVSTILIAQALAANDPHRANAAALVDLEFRHNGRSAMESERASAFETLCASGWNPACQRAAWQVRGVPDLATAAALLSPDCAAGDVVACTVVGWHGLNATDLEEQAAGARALKAACDKGHGPACEAWGQALYSQLGVESLPADGVSRWTTSCAAREQSACLSLAEVRVVEGNPVAATKAATMACHAGNLEACSLWGKLAGENWTGAEAWEFWGGLCDLGNGSACLELATGMASGRWTGVEKDMFGLVRQGCALLDPASCVAAAKAALSLQPSDGASANAWLVQGCALGDPSACAAHTGRVISGDDPTPILEDQGAFERACLDGHETHACGALGSALLASEDPRGDHSRSRALLIASCPETNPSPSGCFDIAQIYEAGNGVQRDRTLAARYHSRACQGGVSAGCISRGALLLDGTGVRKDEALALADFETACSLGDSAGCLGAASLVSRGAPTVAKDVGRALSLFKKACEMGAVDGCLGQGRALESGENGEPDFVGARVAYESAVKADSTEGRHALARLLWNGLGGKKEKLRARVLASEACQQDDADACRGPAAL